MPRNGAGIYSIPLGTDGIPDQTIESTKYNGFAHDVEQDLNLPRPIVAGGTGAVNAHDARVNLQTEVAGARVTNYDTQVWENGSFWSNAATGGPDPAGNYGGTSVLINNDQNYVQLTARDITNPNKIYTRTKNAGTWSAWTSDLPVSGSDPSLVLDKASGTGGHACYIIGKTAGSNRWLMTLGDTVAESGGNVGSDFNISRYADGGGQIDTPVTIVRSTGVVALRSNLTINKADPSIVLQKTNGAAQQNIIYGTTNATARWSVTLGNGTAEAGSNAGSDLDIARYNDDGTFIDIPMNISRASGRVAMTARAIVATPTFGTVSATQGTASLRIAFDAASSGIAPRPSADNAYPLVFLNAADATVGYVNTTSTTTTYATSSDGTLKEDVRDLKAEDIANIIDDTRVVDFKWKNSQERAFGVIAQQAKDVYPAAFSQNNERWFVDYSKYVPVLLQELQALRARVAQLEAGMASKPA
jgi:hypothetical protein